MKRLIAIAAILAMATGQGCATKTYGRQDNVTGAETKSMTCREINRELVRAVSFIDQVDTESAFSGMDVLALLIDFGIGNHLEKTAALDSANMRIAALHELQAAKRCDAGTESGYEGSRPSRAVSGA